MTPSDPAAGERRVPAVVVTGAARGLGRAFAEIAAAEGRCVVLVDREAEALAETAAALAAGGARVQALALDLTAPGAGEAVERRLAGWDLYCDVLVNNAGVGLLGPALDRPLAQSLAVVDLNVRALTELALRFLPGMVARRAGGVINVSSIVARLSGPNMAIYNATKAYIRAVSLALAGEVAGTGVTLTAVYPGRMDGAFWDGLAMRRGRRFHVLPPLAPRAVAAAAWQGFREGKASVVPSLSYKVAAAVLPLLPTRVVRGLTAGMFELPAPRHAPAAACLKPAIVVTGASSGIGCDIARVAARDGLDLVLVARSRPALETLAAEIAGAGPAVHVFAADLCAPGTADGLERFLDERGLYCDVLVNNAGTCFAGAAVRLGLDEQLAMLDLNVRVPTELALRLLPGMAARGRGGVLNVGSLGAYMAAPKMAVYHATKAYLWSLSESLSGELAGSGVTVTCVNPGVVRTPLVDRLPVKRDVFYDLTPTSTPAFTAAAAWRGFRRGAVVVIPSLRDHALAIMFRVLPRRLLPPVPFQ